MFRKKKIEYCESTREINTKEKYWNNFLRPENLINSAIALLTLISVILVYFTLIEMKQQRESTYIPEIAIRNDCEFVIKCDSENPDFYVKIPDYNAVEGSGIKVCGMEIPYLYFTVENIGFGSARNIKFEWANDTYSKFAEYIENQNYYIELRMLEDGDQKIITSQDKRILDSDWPIDLTIPYINVAGSENVTQKLDAKVLGYLIGLSARYSDDIPNIELEVTYENIYGKEYNANIRIKPTSTYIKKSKGYEYLINFGIEMEYH